MTSIARPTTVSDAHTWRPFSDFPLPALLQRIAVAYSLMQARYALGINAREYLVDLLTQLWRGRAAPPLTELLPHSWELGPAPP